MLKRWDSYCASLPQLVQRMQALKDIHEQGMAYLIVYGLESVRIYWGSVASTRNPGLGFLAKVTPAQACIRSFSEIWKCFSYVLALQFSQSLTHLDGVQQEIAKTLDADAGLLNEVRSGSSLQIPSLPFFMI